MLAEIPMAIACGYRGLKFTVLSFSFSLFLSFLKSNVLTYCFPLILVLLPLAIPHCFRDLQTPQDSMPDPPLAVGQCFIFLLYNWQNFIYEGFCDDMIDRDTGYCFNRLAKIGDCE